MLLPLATGLECTTANPDQHDADGDHLGDLCDPCPSLTDHDELGNLTLPDDDGDGCPNQCDPAKGVGNIGSREHPLLGWEFPPEGYFAVTCGDADRDGLYDDIDPCPWTPGDDANAGTLLGGGISGPFDLGSGGPGGWWILIEPGIELPGTPEIAPDVAG